MNEDKSEDESDGNEIVEELDVESESEEFEDRKNQNE